MRLKTPLSLRFIIIILLTVSLLPVTGCSGGGNLAKGGGVYGGVSLNLKAAPLAVNDVTYYLIDFYSYDSTTNTAGSDPLIPTTRMEATQTSVSIPQVPVGTIALVIQGYNADNVLRTVYKQVITVSTGVNPLIEATMQPVDPPIGKKTLIGTVMDSFNIPIPNARVNLVAVKETTTDPAGKFSLTEIDDGTYTLEITKPGYRAYTASVAVQGAGELDLGTITLHEEKTITTSACFGSVLNDDFAYAAPTGDGGQIMVGRIAAGPQGGNVVSGYKSGPSDMYVVKLDADGQMQWQGCYGTPDMDYATYVMPVTDGYMVVGATDNVAAPGHKGGVDYYVVKIANNGTFLWSRCIGSSSANDIAYGLQYLSATDSFLIVGTTNSFQSSPDGDLDLPPYNIISAPARTDVWVVDVGFDINGNPSLNNQGRYGGAEFEKDPRLLIMSDGNIILGCSTDSDDFNAVTNHGTTNDILLMSLNPDLTVNWSQCYGSTADEYVGSIRETPVDHRLLVCGHSSAVTPNGDVSTVPGGGRNIWLFKVDPAQAGPTFIWNHSIGGNGNDLGQWAIENSDGTFLVGGYTNSPEFPGFHAGGGALNDILAARLNPDRTLVWAQCFGGINNDMGAMILNTANGGLAVMGYTNSNDGDVTGNYGGAGTSDLWLINLLGPGL